MLNNLKNGILKMFSIGAQARKEKDDANALAFDELNPLLARQLTELETQIGQLAQAQFEVAAERERMRNDMDILRKAIEKSAPIPNENQVDAMK